MSKSQKIGELKAKQEALRTQLESLEKEIKELDERPKDLGDVEPGIYFLVNDRDPGKIYPVMAVKLKRNEGFVVVFSDGDVIGYSNQWAYLFIVSKQVSALDLLDMDRARHST